MNYKDKLIKNEQLIRDRNRSAKNVIKRYFKSAKNLPNAKLAFACECSDMECTEAVTLSIQEYEQLHEQDNRFVLIKGHKSPLVERTVTEMDHFEVVEKPRLAA